MTAPHLLAADGPRNPRPPDLTCSACGRTRRRCDSSRWLRGEPCCAACSGSHTEGGPDASP